MTKGELINFYGNLQKLGNLRGVKFAYVVARNLALIKPEIEALEKALEASDEFLKYDKERIELAKKFSKKDEKGEPIVVKRVENGVEREVFDGLENNPEWEAAFNVLKEQYKSVLEARELQIKEQNEILKTESTVQLHKIALSDVPQEISSQQMNWIIEIVNEEVLSPYPAK